MITGIGDKGVLNNERIGFSVTSNCNLKYFLVFSTSFSDNGFRNRSKDTYWFYPEDLQIGDKVVLYTKSGADSFKDNGDGSKTYFRYWGLSNPIYTDDKKGVVVAEVSDWLLSKKY